MNINVKKINMKKLFKGYANALCMSGVVGIAVGATVSTLGEVPLVPEVAVGFGIGLLASTTYNLTAVDNIADVAPRLDAKKNLEFLDQENSRDKRDYLDLLKQRNTITKRKIIELVEQKNSREEKAHSDRMAQRAGIIAGIVAGGLACVLLPTSPITPVTVFGASVLSTKASMLLSKLNR